MHADPAEIPLPASDDSDLASESDEIVDNETQSESMTRSMDKPLNEDLAEVPHLEFDDSDLASESDEIVDNETQSEPMTRLMDGPLDKGLAEDPHLASHNSELAFESNGIVSTETRYQQGESYSSTSPPYVRPDSNCIDALGRVETAVATIESLTPEADAMSCWQESRGPVMCVLRVINVACTAQDVPGKAFDRTQRLVVRNTRLVDRESLSGRKMHQYRFPFIFHSGMTNANVSPFFADLFKWVAKGRRVSVLGDGYTGTGKSYTFFHSEYCLTVSAAQVFLDTMHITEIWVAAIEIDFTGL